LAELLMSLELSEHLLKSVRRSLKLLRFYGKQYIIKYAIFLFRCYTKTISLVSANLAVARRLKKRRKLMFPFY